MSQTNADESRPESSRAGRLSGHLTTHLAVLSALVIGVIPVANLSGSGWVDDEGIYALQATTLLDGRWDYHYWASELDPEGASFPLVRASRHGDRYFPYVKHPLYPALLAGGAKALGTGAGLYATSMLGFVLAAAVAWLIAAEFEPRAGPIAFWLTAGSPLVVDAYLLVAHALSAAIAGAAVLVSVRILRAGLTPRRWLAFAGLLAVGVLIRSEALLFAVVLTLAVFGTLARRAFDERRRWERSVRRGRRRAQPLPERPQAAKARLAFVMGLGGLAVIAAAALAERVVVATITRASDVTPSLGVKDPPTGRTASEFLQAKAAAAWQITGSASDRVGAAARPVLLVVALALAVILMWPWLRRWRLGWTVPAGAAIVVCGAYAYRLASFPTESATGFFGAWPVALLALFILPARRTDGAERMIILASVSYALFVFATQYDVGGGAEWGGRFLAPVVPGLAAVVAVGIVRRLEASRRRQGRGGLVRATAVLAAVVLLGPAVSGIWMLHSQRRMDRLFIADVSSTATDTVVIDSSDVSHHRFPLLAWRLNATHNFLLIPPPKAPQLLRTLYEAGLDDITLIHAAADRIDQRSPFPNVLDVTPRWTRSLGGAIHVLKRSGE